MPWRDLPAFTPDWSLPAGVRVLQTECGRGPLPYGEFNLGDHVGDDPARVHANRQRLMRATGVTPVWLRQVHGTMVVDASGCNTEKTPQETPEADAALTQRRGIACAVLTADCLPVLIADRLARVVGAAHAGWRGLAAGVIEELIDAMLRVPEVKNHDLAVWLGPAIGPEAFEVGQDMADAFLAQSALHAGCFKPHPAKPGKLLADLPGLAVNVLQAKGIEDITLSGLCTASLEDRFYSYRRTGVTGRMASLIWLQ